VLQGLQRKKGGSTKKLKYREEGRRKSSEAQKTVQGLLVQPDKIFGEVNDQVASSDLL
jgi:hypothetical protein